jgi:Tol biopolymer transport system component
VGCSACNIVSTSCGSPDGRKLAFINGTDIFIHDLERDIGHRLTFNADARSPVWTPDGKHIAFETVSGGFSLSWIRSDGAREPQRLLSQANPVDSWSFSSDGRRLAYLEANPETGFDLWTLPLDLTDPDRPKPGKPELFLRTPADELVPRFSPDGRLIAYRSNESGNNEIYVRPFPARGGGKWQVSTGGGLYGIWSNNGRELFYETTDNRIMVLDYTVNGDSFVPGKPRLWSGKQIFYPGSSNLDLAPDGRRFAVLTAPEAAGGEKGSLHVTMLLNFFDEVKRRIPVGGK